MATLIDRVEQLTNIQNEAKELFKKKNTDYGDAFAEYGVIGILVRLGDKIKRLQSITNNGITLVEDEKLRDTLIDLHNYAAMGIMLINQGYNGNGNGNGNGNDNGNVNDNENDNDNENEQITNMENLNIEENTNKKKADSIWEIQGSTGELYKRQRYVDTYGTEVNTCSCPSYKFCKREIRTCKHI